MAHLDYIDLLLVFVCASSESLLQDNEQVKQARLQNSLFMRWFKRHNVDNDLTFT